ncbi:hypothetical protein sync_1153 [Synechococcus sp. CC9311]|nr:hypothetical protein sync_1153 [Synechococcus sp. CC9311]
MIGELVNQCFNSNEEWFFEIFASLMVIRLPVLAAISAFVVALGLAAASNAQQERLKRPTCCEGCPMNTKVCEF